MAVAALSPALRLSAHSLASCSGRTECRPKSHPCAAFRPAKLSSSSSLTAISGQQLLPSRCTVTNGRQHVAGVRSAFPGLNDIIVPGERDISSIPGEFRRENLPAECESDLPLWLT
jgi:hypothetical protein